MIDLFIGNKIKILLVAFIFSLLLGYYLKNVYMINTLENTIEKQQDVIKKKDVAIKVIKNDLEIEQEERGYEKIKIDSLLEPEEDINLSIGKHVITI